MKTLSFHHPSRRGSALLITLAFLLLLTVLVIGFLTRAVLETQLSAGSATQNKVDLVAQAATENIIGDLQAEIIAGSPTPTVTAPGLYVPNNAFATVPYPVVPTSTAYTASTTPYTAVPGLENLLKISAPLPFWKSTINGTYNAATTSGPSRASNISTNLPSLNNRSISNARWNKPLFLPPTSAVNLAPQPATNFVAPAWIYVARDGSNPTTFNSSYAYSPAVSPLASTSTTLGANAVTQRYAYTIYNEGGTLDMNVAGTPVNTSSGMPPVSPVQYYKNALAYADLTQLPITWPPPNPLTTNSTLASLSNGPQLINAIVGWRNYASGQNPNATSPFSPSSIVGSFPSYTFPAAQPISGTTPTTYLPTAFDLSILGNTTGFLTTGNSSLAGTLQNLGDNAFASRQQLIQFLLQGIGQSKTFGNSPTLQTTLVNLLPYMGTFTRGLATPSYTPAAKRPTVLPTATGGNAENGQATNGNEASARPINPGFLSSTAQVKASYTRNDGSVATIGTPLVNKRFALSRLAWVTYKGPSASFVTNNGIGAQSDPVINALVSDGIPASYLALGSAPNIQAYFGLTWDSSNNRWQYNVHNPGNGPIMRMADIATAASPHDPDFFELLKAAIHVGSVGRALTPGNGAASTVTDPNNSTATPVQTTYPYPPAYNYTLEASVDAQIIQMGANIIGQYQTAAFPIRIFFRDGTLDSGNGHEFDSVENYPYFYGCVTGFYLVSAPLSTASTTVATTNSGAFVFLQAPIIWNPHDPNSSMGATGTYPTQFRVVADSADPDQVLLNNPSGYASLIAYAVGPTGNNSYDTNTIKSVPGATTIHGTWGTGTGAGSLGSTVTPLTAANTGINITPTPLNNGTPANTLFRDPTILMCGGIAANKSYTTSLVPAHSLLTLAALGTAGSNTPGAASTEVGVPGYDNNMIDNPSYEKDWNSYTAGPTGNVENGNFYIGFCLGAFPMQWITKANTNGTEFAAAAYVAKASGFAADSGAGGQAIYVTYRMQYLRPGASLNSTTPSDWITYDTKYGAPLAANSVLATGAHANTGVSWGTSGIFGGYEVQSTTKDGLLYSCYASDPRTSRFGLFAHTMLVLSGSPNDTHAYNQSTLVTSTTNNNGFPLVAPEWQGSTTSTLGWIDDYNQICLSVRPDPTNGEWFEGPYLPDNTGKTGTKTTINGGGTSYGWQMNNASPVSLFHPGFLEQNCSQILTCGARFEGDPNTNQDKNGSGDFYADPDGIVRRASGGYVQGSTSANTIPSAESASSAVGLPMARVSAYNISGETFNPSSYISPGLVAGTGSSYTTPYSVSNLGYLSQTQSRPYILHRPFRSVAEMGYAFRDTPWKNVDFFTPESGDSALLDVFTLNENTNPSALEAGKIDLNARQPYTLAAVLANAYVDDPQIPTTLSGSTTSGIPTTGATLGGIQAVQSGYGSNSNAATAIAQALVNRTTDANAADITAGSGPLQNISELVGKYNPPTSTPPAIVSPSGSSQSSKLSSSSFYDGMTSYTGFSGGATPSPGTPSPITKPITTFATNLMNVYTANKAFNAFPSAATGGTTNNTPNTSNTPGLAESMAYIQRMHEAPIRALANVGQTRVWNLMIDVIAQTGRFPNSPTVTSLQNFSVEGERRYWVHVAIDRLTGKVLDEQVEVVKE